MPLEQAAIIVSALAAAVAALVAVRQAVVLERAARLQQGWNVLLEIERVMRRHSTESWKAGHAGLLAFYSGQRDIMTRAAKGYRDTLAILDLAALGVNRETVDKRIVTEYLETLLVEDLLSVAMLDDICTLANDPNTYKDLRKLLVATSQKRNISDENPLWPQR